MVMGDLLAGGWNFSWLICPDAGRVHDELDLGGVLRQQRAETLWWTTLSSAPCGDSAGLTFGLTMRYLGMSLGMGVALGYCAAFGTLLPPIFKLFAFHSRAGNHRSNRVDHAGSDYAWRGAVCLSGIGIAALAGLTKEGKCRRREKKKAIAEFNFTKGILVATFSGIMSACFAFALTAGTPIGEARGPPERPSSGAACRNWWWFARRIHDQLYLVRFLNIKNRTGGQYFSSAVRNHPDGTGNHHRDRD